MPKPQTIPKYLPQNFETHRDAVERRRLNRTVLLAAGRPARRLRRRLRACQPGNRCESEACKVWCSEASCHSSG